MLALLGPLRGRQQVVLKGPVLVAAGEVELAGLDSRGHLQKQQGFVERRAQPALRIEHVRALREREKVQRHLRAHVPVVLLVVLHGPPEVGAGGRLVHDQGFGQRPELGLQAQRGGGQRLVKQGFASLLLGGVAQLLQLLVVFAELGGRDLVALQQRVDTGQLLLRWHVGGIDQGTNLGQGLQVPVAPARDLAGQLLRGRALLVERLLNLLAALMASVKSLVQRLSEVLPNLVAAR